MYRERLVGMNPINWFLRWWHRDEEWKAMINYAIRNIEIGDGEQVRLGEDKEGFMSGFKEEGVSEEDLKVLDDLLWEDSGHNLLFEAITDILYPYMSHRWMYKYDYDRWEWRTWNDEDEFNTGAYEEYMKDW